MAKKESLFEDEKYPVKGLEYGFFIMGPGCFIAFIVLIFQVGSFGGSGLRADHWSLLLSLIFTFAITYYSLTAIVKSR